MATSNPEPQEEVEEQTSEDVEESLESGDKEPDSPPSPKASDFIVKPVSPARLVSADAKPASKRKSQVQKDDGHDLECRKRVKGSGDSKKEGKVKEKKVSAVSASGASVRVWSDEDEIVVLEGMIDFQKSKGFLPSSDFHAFHEFIKGKLNADMSKTQLYEKVRRFRNKFLSKVEKAKGSGKDPVFSNAHESKVYELSKRVWGSYTNTSAGTSGIREEDKKKRAAGKVRENVKAEQKKSAAAKVSENGDAEQKKSAAAKVGESVKAEQRKGAAAKVSENVKAEQKKGAAAKVSENVNAEQRKSAAAKVSDNVSGEQNEVVGMDDVKNDDEDFESKYPHLSQSFDDGFRFLRDDLRSFLKKNLSVIKSAKAEELEEKWKKLCREEAKFSCKKLSLMEEQTELVLNALKN